MIFLIRLLLRWTRPEVAPDPQKKHLPLSVSLHVSLLKYMAKYYAMYSSIDLIQVGKTLTIKHSVRDFGFEQELKRMNIDLTPHLKSYPYSKNKHNNRSYRTGIWYSFFNFKDTLSLSGFGKEINIDRIDSPDVYGTFTASVKVGAESDFISTSSTKITLPKKSNPHVSKPSKTFAKEEVRTISDSTNEIKKKEDSYKGKSVPTVKPEVKPKGGLFAKDTIPAHKEEKKLVNDPPVQAEPKNKVDKGSTTPRLLKPEQVGKITEAEDIKPEIPETTTTIVRGIEIDDDF